MNYQQQVELSRPAAEVWAVVGDYGQDTRWRGGLISMSPEPPGPVRVGTTVREVARFMGVTLTTPGEVVEVSEGRCFRWRVTGGPIEFQGERLVEDLGPGRSRVRLSYEGRFTGILRPLEPLVFRMFRSRVRGDAAGLRALLS
jgi:hypothetical protein